MAAYENKKPEARVHSVRELFGDALGSNELFYFTTQVSLDALLTVEQENILLRYKGKLLSGEMSMDGQYYLARKLENEDRRKNKALDEYFI